MLFKIAIVVSILIAVKTQHHHGHTNSYIERHAQIGYSNFPNNHEESRDNDHHHILVNPIASHYGGSGIAQQPVHVTESSHQVQDKHSDQHAYDFSTHPKFPYEYEVEDPHTGDRKSHYETRGGDVVKAHYSFQEADGSIGAVEYTSDKHNGLINIYLPYLEIFLSFIMMQLCT